MAVRHVRARATSLQMATVNPVASAPSVVNVEGLARVAHVVGNNVAVDAMNTVSRHAVGHAVLNVNGEDLLGMTLLNIQEASQLNQRCQ